MPRQHLRDSQITVRVNGNFIFIFLEDLLHFFPLNSGQNGLEMNGKPPESGTALASASASESASTSPSTAPSAPQQQSPAVASGTLSEMATQMFDSSFTPDKWPPQLFQPVKLAEIQRKPTDVIVPSDGSTPAPSNVINKYKLTDFNVQGNLITTARFCEIYPGKLNRNGIARSEI